MDQEKLRAVVAAGGYAVLPTDTIYGIVCDARNEPAVEGLYRIKQRTESKPFIVLLSDTAQLELFHIPWKRYESTLERYWPGPVSIILPCTDEQFRYLHRGTHTIAFRLPAKEELRELLRKTGPLVAPSANPEREPPAATIAEARQYFGDQVACYIDGGELRGAPSTIISIETDGTIAKLR